MIAETKRGKIQLPLELKWFIGLSALLWLLSISFIVYRVHVDPQFPHGLPLPFYTHPFTDLNTFISKLGMIHQPEFFTADYKWIYPAPCLFLYKFILHFDHYSYGHGWGGEVAYLSMILVGLLLLAGGVASALTRRGLSWTTSGLLMVATVVLSWPIIVAVHTGNIEAILWIGVALAAWAYYRNMWWTVAILIGIVGSFKLYPLLLLGLFLAPRKYSQIALSLLIFATMTIGGLAYIGPTIPVAYHNVANGVRSVTDLGFYPGEIDRDYLTFEHSLVSLIRICTSSHPRLMVLIFRYYMPIVSGLMAILFFARLWKMPRLNQLFIIILAAVMLPPKSYDYTLQMLYIPWAWLALLGVAAAARRRRVPGLMPAMVCLALICSPEFFIKFHGYYSFGQFKTIVLLGLLWVAVRYRFEDEPSQLSLTPQHDFAVNWKHQQQPRVSSAFERC